MDEEMTARFGGAPPPREWFGGILADKNRSMFTAVDAGNVVGMVDLERDETGQIGYVGFAVAPSHRRKGYGKAMLRAFLGHQIVRSLSCLRGAAEQDNVASVKCLHAAGFVAENDKPDKDGFIQFKYVVQ